MGREFDFIVNGASGFTARYVVKELLKSDNKFALCGRSKERILKNLESLDVEDIKIFESQDYVEVFKNATVVINCAGPYILCGEPVVAACVEVGTHYVDITGEPFFIENMIEKYHEKAVEKNVCIVNCCGWDSVPADIGLMYLESVLDNLTKARSYMTAVGTHVNTGTYYSLVHGLGNAKELGKSRSKRGKTTDAVIMREKLRKFPFYSEITKGYCVPFMGSDVSVVRRTQMLLRDKGLQKVSPSYNAYINIGQLIHLIAFLFFGSILLVLAQFKLGRNVLKKYPRLFTGGLVKPGGPSEEEIAKSSFTIYFQGESGSGDKAMVKVSGPDPGYTATSICCVTCAQVLLQLAKSDKQLGGIVTPASAFRGTDIVQRLCDRGVLFEKLVDKTKIQ